MQTAACFKQNLPYITTQYQLLTEFICRLRRIISDQTLLNAHNLQFLKKTHNLSGFYVSVKYCNRPKEILAYRLFFYFS